jgi:hypothetical protein
VEAAPARLRMRRKRPPAPDDDAREFAHLFVRLHRRRERVCGSDEAA